MTTTAASAWSAKATTPVSMLHIGDSVTEGTGGGGFEAKYTTKLLRGLQSSAGITGGPGFVNTGSFVPVDNSFSSYWNPQPGSPQTGGLLGDRVGSFAVDQAVTVTWTGTSLGVHFFENYGGALPFTVSIDGGAASTVTVPTAGPPDQRGVWHSATFAHGTHTALITPSSGASLVLRGVYVYDGDETKGVHGWEGGHWGIQSGGIVADLSGFFADSCQLIQPAVATLFIGLNDWESGVAAATYQANMVSIVNAVNGYCTVPPSWVICGIYRRTDVTSPTVPLSDYTAAAQAVVAADATNRRFVDLNTAGVTLGGDGIHPTATGHAAIAAAIQPAILDLANASSGWTPLTIERWTGSAWVSLLAEEWNGASWAPVVIERSV